MRKPKALEEVCPMEFRRDGSNGVSITWSDSTTEKISSEVLRVNCPCATCRELNAKSKSTSGSKRSLQIVQSYSEEAFRIDKVWSIGQYAIGVAWGDGHSTGIYTYKLLYGLAAHERTKKKDAGEF